MASAGRTPGDGSVVLGADRASGGAPVARPDKRRRDDDLRIANVLVADRVGAIGYSPVAEAYRNFGSLGVVIVPRPHRGGDGRDRHDARRRTAVLTLAIVTVRCW